MCLNTAETVPRYVALTLEPPPPSERSVKVGSPTLRHQQDAPNQVPQGAGAHPVFPCKFCQLLHESVGLDTQKHGFISSDGYYNCVLVRVGAHTHLFGVQEELEQNFYQTTELLQT